MMIAKPRIFVPLVATVFVMLFMWLSAVPILSWYEQSAAHQQLDDAEFQWHHRGSGNYSFEFDAFGPVDFAFRLPIRIHVRDGAFDGAYDVDTGRPVDIGGRRDVPGDIPAAFALVADLLERQAYSVDVRYDEYLYYPARIEFRLTEADRESSVYYLRSFRETDPDF